MQNKETGLQQEWLKEWQSQVEQMKNHVKLILQRSKDADRSINFL